MRCGAAEHALHICAAVLQSTGGEGASDKYKLIIKNKKEVKFLFEILKMSNDQNTERLNIQVHKATTDSPGNSPSRIP